MSKFIQILVGAFALTLAVAQQARADVQIMPPTQPVAGQSQLSWAEEWYRWVSGIPAANNPILDTTGNNARVNNNRPVFFLAGTFGTGPVARKIKVPYGKPVIFPVLNQAFAAVNFETGNYDPSPCTSPLTVKCAIGALSISKAVNMSVQIDGVTLDNQQVCEERSTVRENVKRVALERAVVSLPLTERLVFLLHDVEGYSHERTAHTLGISADESVFGLHQARIAIRQAISKMKV